MEFKELLPAIIIGGTIAVIMYFLDKVCSKRLGPEKSKAVDDAVLGIADQHPLFFGRGKFVLPLYNKWWNRILAGIVLALFWSAQGESFFFAAYFIACSFALADAGKNIILSVWSLSWPTTSGRVISSKIERHWNRRDIWFTFRPKICYEYEINKKTYTSCRTSFEWHMYQYGLKRIENLTTQYGEGMSANVRYFTGDPRLSILMPGIQMGAMLELVTAIVMLIWPMFIVAPT